MNRTILLVVLSAVIGSVFLVQPVLAHGNLSLTEPIIPSTCTDTNLNEKKSPCGVNEIIHTMIHIAGWILAVVGAVGLVMFVYGGFVWITSGGNSARVDQGRRILVGTVVGLVIVIGAFTVVRFIGETLGNQGSVPEEFSQFLDDSTSSAACSEDGERCSRGGDINYSCYNGACTSISMCQYWAGKPGSLYSIGYEVSASHRCVSSANCQPGSIIPNFCPQNSPSEGDTCCIPK